MRIAIDARLWGEPRSGIGRYTRALVEARGGKPLSDEQITTLLQMIDPNDKTLVDTPR